MAGANWMGGKRNSAKARSKDPTGRAQKGHFGRIRHEIFSKDMAKISQQQSSVGKARVQEIELAHAKADGSVEQQDRIRHPGSPPSASGFFWTIGKKKPRSSKVLEALKNLDGDKDQIALKSILRLPDLVGLTTSRSRKPTSHKPSRTTAARTSGSSVSMSKDSLPEVAGQLGIYAATRQTSSITEHHQFNWITTPSPHPSRIGPMRMPSTPRKPLYSYTQADPGSDEYQDSNALWTDVDDEIIEQGSGFVEFGSSDRNQTHIFWDLSPALSQHEATYSEFFTGQQLSNVSPDNSVSSSPATSLAILEFSSPPPTRSALHRSPPARHVFPAAFSGFSHSGHAYNQPDPDSHFSLGTPVRYEDNADNADFDRNSSRKSRPILEKSYDKPITLGTFLDDPDPWNAIGRFLNLAPLNHHNNYSPVSSNSRAGVGWSSSCSSSSSGNFADNDYGMDVETQEPLALSPSLSTGSLAMAIDAVLSRSCSPVLSEHASTGARLEPSRPDSLPSLAMDSSVSGASRSSLSETNDLSRINAAPGSTKSDLPEPSPSASAHAADPKEHIRSGAPTAVEPSSATAEESTMAEDGTKSDTTDASREPEVLCLFADGALELQESDEEGFM